MPQSRTPLNARVGKKRNKPNSKDGPKTSSSKEKDLSIKKESSKT